MSSDCATKKDILKWIQPILKDQNDYIVNVSANTETVNGYLGDITFVQVTSGESDTLDLVIKNGKKSHQQREKGPVRSAFKNEMSFYNEILPTFIDFQKEKGIKEPFDNVPKCHGTLLLEKIEVIILKDISNEYSLHDKTKPMNLSHLESVVKIYGKLHAISFALRDQKPEFFQKLASKLTDILKLSTETNKSLENIFVLDDALNFARMRQDSELVEKILVLKRGVKSLSDLTDPFDPYAVIVHGECWNNKFMFKYEKNQERKPSRVCLLDFQFSRLASPAYDLSYFLFTCISQNDLKKFDEIIDVYYESFCTFLQELGSDPKKMFPYEELINQLQRFSRFGLTLLPHTMKLCLLEEDQVDDSAETASFGCGLNKNGDEYERRTFSVLKFAIAKKII